MEEEFMFWIENRMTTIALNDEEYTLAHYTSNVSYPRPGIIKHYTKICYKVEIIYTTMKESYIFKSKLIIQRAIMKIIMMLKSSSSTTRKKIISIQK